MKKWVIKWFYFDDYDMKIKVQNLYAYDDENEARKDFVKCCKSNTSGFYRLFEINENKEKEIE